MNNKYKKELIDSMVGSLASDLSDFIDDYEGSFYALIEDGKINIYQKGYDDVLSSSSLNKASTSYLDAEVNNNMHEEDREDFIKKLEERKDWLENTSKEMDRLIDIYKLKR